MKTSNPWSGPCEDEPLKALVFGFGIALAGAALIEGVRRWGARLWRAVTP